MIDFTQVEEARKLLELPEKATMKEIKGAYRRLSLKYHPDKCSETNQKKCEEMFKKISWAYDIIMDYCASYKYSFKEDDIKNEHLPKFHDGWF